MEIAFSKGRTFCSYTPALQRKLDSYTQNLNYLWQGTVYSLQGAAECFDRPSSILESEGILPKHLKDKRSEKEARSEPTAVGDGGGHTQLAAADKRRKSRTTPKKMSGCLGSSRNSPSGNRCPLRLTGHRISLRRRLLALQSAEDSTSWIEGGWRMTATKPVRKREEAQTSHNSTSGNQSLPLVGG